MEPSKEFLNQSHQFWALGRLSSECLGYSDRTGKGQKLRKFETNEILNLDIQASFDKHLAEKVSNYLNFRAILLEEKVKSLLMDRKEAKKIFENLCKNYKAKCRLPMNKQKGEKRHYSYLTCIVNILTEKSLNESFDDRPGKFTVITDHSNKLVITLSRWIDGAYPSTLNPTAIWEIKEYYGTTTFGSRVADGIYESQLDGYEINIAEEISKRRIFHYLIVDDLFTWWVKGKSYLCRLIDMMHMKLANEIIFGKEVLTRWPEIVKSWKEVTK